MQSRNKKYNVEGKDAMYFRDAAHKRNFVSRVKRNPNKCDNDYLAALYLLTADKTLWLTAQKEITNEKISIEDINIRGISPMGYMLIKVASDIKEKSTYLSLADIGDKHLVSNEEFRIIITALKISRRGYEVIDCVKKPFML